MRLQAADFGEFLEAVHGHRPFRWQTELVEQVVATGSWPTALDVPTGMGKTVALDVAVFALAAQSALPPEQRTAPTRTFLVVDRRVIVDQAHDRAQRIVEALAQARAGSGVLAAVADSLRAIAGTGAPPLQAVRMRGGTTWSSRWLSSTRHPAIITGTVDQLGSRMLFRGYGVSDRMLSVDAALCGNDSLVLLDEAHLSGAFLQTVDAVRAAEQQAATTVLGSRRPTTVVLSATLRDRATADDRLFRCDPSREDSIAARQRLDAVKTTRLIDVRSKGELAGTLERLARSALNRGGRVMVVCNTVLLARQVFARLGDLDEGADRALLIGRCRDVEKERTTATWVDRIRAGSTRGGRPVVVVATQTVEVGADLDVDVLITEACPVDALVQRLGRLDRLGEHPGADAVVVWDSVRHELAERTPVYGAAVAATWQWLAARAGVPSPSTPASVVGDLEQAPSLNLGLCGPLADLDAGQRAALGGRQAPVPVVLSPVLDMWAQTSPVPVPDQPVAPFLHGLVRPRPEVTLAWRDGLNTAEDWDRELRLFPCRSHETVSVGLVDALRFLAGAPPAGTTSDIEGTPDQDDPFDERPTLIGRVVNPDGTVRSLDDAPLRPGSIILLHSSAGGHDAWGWTGVRGDEHVPDVADLSPTGAYRVRLREPLWRSLLGPGTRELAWPRLDDDRDLGQLLAGLAELAGSRADEDAFAAELETVVTGVRHARGRREVRDDELLLAVTRSRPEAPDTWRRAALERADEDQSADSGASSSATVAAVTLDQHLRDVGRVAEAEAVSLGLPESLVRAVRLAGLAHDLGKADHRFQLVLHGGDRYRAELATALLAKSPAAQDSRMQRRAARISSGWPAGMRHESISAALVRDLARRECVTEVDIDLVVHLVASHHGYARPLLPPVHDGAPAMVVVPVPGWFSDDLQAAARSDDGIIDWDHPRRFAELNGRYGRWGLALLEAVVRLSDMSESERYDYEADQR